MRPEKIVLDLGCGANPHSDASIAMDIDNVTINTGNIDKKIVYDLNKIPYPFEDSSVDKIYATQILEHLSIHSFKFFQECHRILKPDGVLILELPNAFHYEARFRYLFGRYIGDTSFHPFHVKLLKPSYLVEHLRYLGFSVHLERTTSFWSAVGLEQMFPDLFARGISVTARKRR